MNNISITKDEFEGFAPAFRSPTGEVFSKMQSFTAQTSSRWDNEVKAGADVSAALVNQIKRAVVLRAAYLAVPHLDLVLTPTGFGIVSNQNTAPASRERVDALREELRRSASDVEDFVLQSLLAAHQLKYPEQKVRSLLWTPTLMRLYGVTTADGKTVYREEFVALAAPLAAAEAFVGNIISPELLAAMSADLYTEDEPSAVRAVAIEHTRRLLAAHIAPASSHLPAKDLARVLLNYVRTHADSFPEYISSPTYAAQTFSQYANQKNDTTFFFG